MAHPYSRAKFESALDFLDQVKTVFGNNPLVYNMFLDIMKEFKAHQIDTPGVIVRVKSLFKGHHDLILGFNSFLPPGFEITEDDISDSEKEKSSTVTQPKDNDDNVRSLRRKTTRASAKASQVQKKPEFDHARDFVKKIKSRFMAEPEIYKTFLEILHTYHKEQHSIQAVYRQVSRLFANHQDLLDEFVQFLPDPNARVTGRENETSSSYSHRGGSEEHSDVVEPRKTRRTRRSGRTPGKRTTTHDKRNSPDRVSITHYPFSMMEPLLRVKLFIEPESWIEFVKCLELLNMQVIGRIEFLMLVRDLLGSSLEAYKLFDSLREYMSVTEEEFNDEDVGIGDLDLSNCERNGMSYRKCLDTFRYKPCSGATELAQSVLNNVWISRPTGEEAGVFKSSRKNDYEEKLFRCEDERFEFDIYVERTASAIRALERLIQKLADLSYDNRIKYKIRPDDLS
jgi:paired amphipathic helix protein Sin3a